MKAVKVYDFEDIRVEDLPVPEIGPREILVRTKACGICSGDIMPWYIRSKAPLVLGHEPAGVVARVGSEVSRFRAGDRVFVHHHAPCFDCHHCRRGDYAMCETWKRSRIDPGGMAEYFRVPEVNLTDTLLLSDEVSFEDGALVEPAACVVKALKRARVRTGDTVLVIGLGVMGQMLALLARHYGAGRVVGADLVDYRRRKALELGADLVVDPQSEDLAEAVKRVTGGRLADVVIVGPPSMAAAKSGLACAGKGSTVLLFTPTPPGELLSAELHHLYFNEISLTPSYSCGPDDTREALQLISEGVLRASEIVTHRYSLDEAPRAFREMVRGGEVLKAMVLFD